MLSVLDLFRVGLGPSSSHTVGPMRITRRVLRDARRAGVLSGVARVEVELQGSLALTGIGHSTDKAAILGLLGFDPATADPNAADEAFLKVARDKALVLERGPEIAFNPVRDIIYNGEYVPDIHPNGIVVRLYDGEAALLLEDTYYSTGGGFIATRERLAQPAPDDLVPDPTHVPYAFESAAHLYELCQQSGLGIAELVLANEDAHRPREETLAQLDHLCDVMMACIDRGLHTPGTLPGGLQVSRRAPALFEKLQTGAGSNEREALFDWLNVYAMAVNEENAAGGRVVTAPTNGAAGILPAVMRHYCSGGGTFARRKAQVFLLVAGAIGLLYKQRASISGAEMGCQGEVGVACSMAAGGLAAVWGAEPKQCLAAAVIGMEHNLGLTCDPVGGLVQIPCIERNAIGTVKAVNGARLALHSTGQEKVSLDQVIETMRQTGLDMSSKYKETSQGGLAVNVVAC